MKYFLSIFLFALPIFATADTKLKVGVVAPLSGPAASAGEAIRNSITLASKNLDPTKKVNFIFEDDQMLPKNTVTAVNKLISSDQVHALIVFGTPTAAAVNSIAEQQQIPMIALSILDTIVNDKKFVVKHWVRAETENQLVVGTVRKRNYQRVAVVSTVNDAMLKLKDLFQVALPELVVTNEELNKDDMDFKTVIARLQASKPDAVYVLLWPPQPGLFVRQLREAGYKGEVFGAHNLEDLREVSSSNNTLVGSWFVTGNDKNAKDFYASYQKTYGDLPAAGGVNAYDVAYMLIRGSSAENLNHYLHNINNFTGLYGSYTSSGVNDFTIPAAIKVIKSNGFELQAELP